MNKAYLAKIVNDSYVHPAPQKPDWVEVIISIDADHVAYLTMPMDAYEQLTELESRLENAAEEAEALSRFRAERAANEKIVPTTVRTEWYGRMW